jgi:hypothetical protein
MAIDMSKNTLSDAEIQTILKESGASEVSVKEI